MKFKDKDGKVYEDIETAWHAWSSDQGSNSLSGEMFKTANILGWSMHHPIEAASLMGYEVVQDEKEITRMNEEKTHDKREVLQRVAGMLDALYLCASGGIRDTISDAVEMIDGVLEKEDGK